MAIIAYIRPIGNHANQNPSMDTGDPYETLPLVKEVLTTSAAEGGRTNFLQGCVS